jgi:hypothetical protein
VCSAADAHWAMVPSRAVSRLLAICDPDGALPITESVKEGKSGELRLLQLVPQPR